jgi:hypothetical protein
MKLCLLLLVIFTTTAAFAQSRSQAREYRSIQALEASVKSLAAQDLRCHTSRDCRVLPIGHLACGGPQDFVVTSGLNLNLAEIEYLAQRTEQREQAYNIRWGVISPCVMRMPPTPTCIRNTCL